LARNLGYVLRSLEACGPSIVDVLLFCRLSETAQVPATCGSFRIVKYLCTPDENSGFFRLSS